MMRVFFEPTFLYQPQLINCYQLGLIPERDVLFGTRLQQHQIALLFVNTDRVSSARQAETRDSVKIFSLALSRPFSQRMLLFFVTSSSEMQ
jgi:hypothetical protein